MSSFRNSLGKWIGLAALMIFCCGCFLDYHAWLGERKLRGSQDYIALSPTERAKAELISHQNVVPSSSQDTRKLAPGSACDQSLPLPLMPGKKGIGMTLRTPDKPGSYVQNMPKVLKLNVKWNYSWGSKRAPNQPADIEWIPMVWGYWGDNGLQNDINNNILPLYNAGIVNRFLAFNEPDHTEQSNLDVSTVVNAWPILESTQIPLASPSAVQATGDWMQSFMETADEDCLRMEYIGVHWYGGASFKSFKSHMEEAYALYGSKRPLLITEFAPADWGASTPEDNKFSEEQVLAFMKQAIPWLMETDWITGFAWFPFSQSNAAGTRSALFVDGSTELTTCGKYYASVTDENPQGDQTIFVPTPSPTMSPTECGQPLSLPDMPGKKGIGLSLKPAGQPGSYVQNIPKVQMLNVKWNFSWDTKRAPNQPADIEWIPMVWGYWGDVGLQNNIDNNIMPHYNAGTVKRILAFHEPDSSNQSNLSVTKAINAWPVLRSTRIPLASPSASQSTGSWMQSFVETADANCLRMEYVAIHWYGGADFQSFKTKMEDVYAMYGRPLLLTELAIVDWSAATPEQNDFSEAQVLAFMKEALPWLMKTSWIEGFAWKSFAQSSSAGTSSALFVDGSTELTTCGKYYASVTDENPQGDQTIFVPSPTASPTMSPTECGQPLPLPAMPGKKGIGLALKPPGQPGSYEVNIPKVQMLNVKWNFSWDTKRAPNQPANIEWIPMVWGYWGDVGLQNNIDNNIMPHYDAGTVKRILAFHEPDSSNQSNLSVTKAINAWPVLQLARIPLASPSASQSTGSWMQSFVETADANCLRMEYVAIHWYGGANFQSFKTKMEDVYAMYERPLFLTELAIVDWSAATPEQNDFSEAQVLAFMKEALPWLMSTSWIEGFAWKSFAQSSAAGTSSALFVDGSTVLTACGQYYASVTDENPQGDQTITA